MNIKKESYHLAFFSLLILNMLLIFSGVFSQFFNIEDYTLIAGIIAFIGAIIGGFITLIGVNKTIFANKRIEQNKKMEEDLITLKLVRNLLIEIEEYCYRVEDIKSIWEFPVSNILSKTSDAKLNTSLSLIDIEIYEFFFSLHLKLVGISGIIYMGNELGYKNSYDLQELKYELGNLLDLTKNGISFLEEKDQLLTNQFVKTKDKY